MASLHKFSLTLTLISSLLLIISFQSINAEDGDLIADQKIMEGEGNVHVASVDEDNDFITRFCATKYGFKQECINYFRSNKQVVAAAAKNKSLDLALAILNDLVIPQVKTTHDVLLKKKQATPETYDFCEAEYAKVIPSLESILEVTTKNKGNKDEHRFDLIRKAIAKCSFDLNDKKVLDREFTEAEGNALIALGAANDLLSAESVHEDNDLITRYCATMLGSKQECINYFRSNEQVVAAAAKNKSLDLALAILKDLVIPQVKSTHDVLLKKKQATPKTYDFCEAEYAKVIPSLESILEVTTKNKGNNDEHRFDLIKKAIVKCSFDLNGKKIVDAKLTEAEGNALVALSAADNLLSGIYG